MWEAATTAARGSVLAVPSRSVGPTQDDGDLYGVLILYGFPLFFPWTRHGGQASLRDDTWT